jgi:hypothetical protein
MKAFRKTDLNNGNVLCFFLKEFRNHGIIFKTARSSGTCQKAGEWNG